MKTYQQTLMAIVVGCLPGLLLPAVVVVTASPRTEASRMLTQ